MSTPQGDPEGPSSLAGAGLWGGLLKRLGRSQTPASPGGATDGPESTYSREALQGMIERKRHNDLVRHREFDALRKLRRTQESAAPVQAVHPLPFHSSISSGPHERATTLKKIDEIEAQMSIQWRRVKARPPVHPVTLARLNRGADTTIAGTGTTRSSDEATAAASAAPDTVHLSTQASLSRQPVPAAWSPTTQPAVPPGDAAFVHDPELDDAALRFASGDTAGAESALKALLAHDHPRSGQPETWQVLFDLYRATGQQSAYDDCAADYAQRFQRSPPQWRRLHEPAASDAPNATDAPDAPDAHAGAAAPGEPPDIDWACPAVLDAQGLHALQAMLAASRLQPWRLSWVDLTALAPDALPVLAQLVAQWARQPVRLRCVGMDRLERILDARTACGDRSGDPLWWRLRLDWLRAMRRSEEFELVALDYCVTYEVSPPSWDAPLCDVRASLDDDTAQGHTGFDAIASRVSTLGPGEWGALSGFGASAFAPATLGAAVGAPVGELAGTLLGDLGPQLARLEARLPARPQDAEALVVVSCSRLERIDFEAAGALVNWVAARQAEGRTVHLADVHRLVAAFLGAMGLATQARITLRPD